MGAGKRINHWTSVAGGIAFGPAGAIVGALSAMKPKALEKLTVIKLSFCETKSFTRRDIYFRMPRGSSKVFILRVKKEMGYIH